MIKTEYPFIYGGSVIGTLTVTAEGLFTVFELISRYIPEILRVSVYGNGTPFYLGIPQPKGTGLYLCRRLTKQEAKKVPPDIKYAACGEEADRRAVENETAADSGWLRHSDGTLTCKNVLAIPASLRKSVPGTVIKKIDGKTYMLFRY